jgi:adenosylmethionine-8-amino-7-oxononanoate aminotransferase
VQKVIQRDGLLAQVRSRGATLQTLLQEQFGSHPNVGDIRGRGLFWGVELVTDRGTKQWFDPALKLHARIKREAMAQGLMVYPMAGTVDGKNGDHILLAPPFISSEADLAEIVARLGRSVDSAIASCHG